MLFRAPGQDIYIRIVAMITLFIGLSDAARLLGISLGDTSPISALGLSGFIHLAVFSFGRLLAAVGLWLKASWGVVMLVGTTVVELLVYGLGTADIEIGMLSFAMRAVILLAVLVIFGLSIRFQRAQAD
jgi:hypothetical protein